MVVDNSVELHDLLLALGMEINPTDLGLNLVQAYVIETLETRSSNASGFVIRYKKMFLPSHEYMFLVPPILA